MNNQRTAYSRQAWESHYGMIHSVGSLAIIPPLFITGDLWPVLWVLCGAGSYWLPPVLLTVRLLHATSHWSPPPFPTIVKLNSVKHQYSAHSWTVTCYQWLVMSCVIRQTNYCHIVWRDSAFDLTDIPSSQVP